MKGVDFSESNEEDHSYLYVCYDAFRLFIL